jgi:hypothetical protein
MEYKIDCSMESGAVYYQDIGIGLYYPFRYVVERDSEMLSSLVTSDFEGGVISCHGQILKFKFTGKFFTPHEKADFITPEGVVFCSMTNSVEGFWSPERKFTIDFSDEFPQLQLKRMPNEIRQGRSTYSIHGLFDGELEVARVLFYRKYRRLFENFNCDKYGMFECKNGFNELHVACILALVHISDYLESFAD